MGFFEPSGLLLEGVSEETEAPAILRKAVDYAGYDKFLERINMTISSYQFNIANRDGFLLSKYGRPKVLTMSKFANIYS